MRLIAEIAVPIFVTYAINTIRNFKVAKFVRNKNYAPNVVLNVKFAIKLFVSIKLSNANAESLTFIAQNVLSNSCAFVEKLFVTQKTTFYAAILLDGEAK
jgi:hypothetical protein